MRDRRQNCGESDPKNAAIMSGAPFRKLCRVLKGTVGSEVCVNILLLVASARHLYRAAVARCVFKGVFGYGCAVCALINCPLTPKDVATQKTQKRLPKTRLEQVKIYSH